jgi:dihydrofolate synthase/folylpolyglutamate synthase
MRYQNTLDWLFAQLPMYQRVGQVAYKADLNNTLALMEHLGHPEKGLTCIHVGGTNGKGSVSHMLAAIFQAAGYKTGLYTSPHLKDFRERIRVNGQMISKAAVSDFVDAHKAAFTNLGLSFFEMTVGLAFAHFRAQQTDIAIIEVGMGGRLDSTNVVIPKLSIITNISLDHTQFLGDTLAKIAAEKAGIIKNKVPVLIGEKHEETDAVFTEKAQEKNAPLFFAEEQTNLPTVRQSDLSGPYQEKNRRTVLAAVQILQKQGYDLEPHLASALSQVGALTGLRGRWEILGNHPKIITDTAHNEAGVAYVAEQLRRESFRQLHIVWGMVGDKDSSAILRMLPKSAIYYFCKPNIPRGLAVEELKSKALTFGLSGKSYPSVSAAYTAAQKATLTDDLIFVGGSVFVVAEVV